MEIEGSYDGLNDSEKRLQLKKPEFENLYRESYF